MLRSQVTVTHSKAHSSLGIRILGIPEIIINGVKVH